MKSIFTSTRHFVACFLLVFVTAPLAAQTGYTYPLSSEAQLVARTLAAVYGAPVATVEAFLHEAVALEQSLGIPAAATTGIAVLESGGFSSALFQQARNPFGIKASAPWAGPTIGYWHDGETTSFRAYGSIEEAVRDFGAFVYTRRWFSDAFTCPTGDYHCFLDGLAPNGPEPGYSLDLAWAAKVRDVIQRYDIGSLGRGATAGQ